MEIASIDEIIKMELEMGLKHIPILEQRDSPTC